MQAESAGPMWSGKTLREQLTLLAEAGHLWGWNAVGDIFWEGKAAERNLPYVIERCEKTAGYGMTAMPAASWGACIFTVGIRLWTIRGRFNGWRGMGNRNTPGIICRALLSAGIRLPAGPGAGKSILGENQGFAL